MSDVKIDRRVFDKLVKRIKDVDKHHARVGILSNKEHDGIGVLELAAIHEFGSPAAGIPERSFIRSTFDKNKKALLKLQARVAEEILAGRMSPKEALELIGQWGVSEINKTVREGEGVKPKLKPSTIAKKGSSRPLIDTGRMLGAVQYEVKKG